MNPLYTRPNRWRPITVFNLLVGLLFSLSALAQPAFLKEGLVAYYPMDGSANDASGNGNDGVASGTTPFSDRFNKEVGALRFNGDGANVKLGPQVTSVISNGVFSFSFWVKISSGGTWSPRLMTSGMVDVGIDSTTGSAKVFYGGSGFDSGNNIWSPDRIESSKYYNIAGTYDRFKAVLYINGKLVATQTSSWGARGYKNAPATVGMNPENGSDRFSGAVDDIRIYDRALSTAEIQALYNYDSRQVKSTFQVIGGGYPPPIGGGYSWQAAYDDSLQRGGHLATITSLEEQLAVAAVISNSGLSKEYHYWLGGSDAKSEGNWEWITGEAFKYSKWGSGEPNNALGKENYLEILPFGVSPECYWNDSLAAGSWYQYLYGYILEFPFPNLPAFSEQPQSQTVAAGKAVTFCIKMKEVGYYGYQWQIDGQDIAGANSNCYTANLVDTTLNGRGYRVIAFNSAGTVMSEAAILNVVNPPPPLIVTQPVGKTVQEGSNVSFAVIASGQSSLVYQWQLNEQNLPGAISANLNLNGVKLNTAGRYRVLISSQYGLTISDTVTLTVNPNPPPTIVTQPLSRTPAEGTQVSLTVTATGLGSLTYQWQVNGQNIPGATSSTLVLSAVRPSANGNYRVIVGNPYGTTISTEATVTVIVTDSDSDGLSDYEELLLGTNANKADTDGDGLSDFAEVRTHKSNPLTTDTDGDGYSDGIEVARDGNPNNRSVTPTGALAVFPAVDVEFYTLNSVKYQLEVSTDMVSWTAQGGVVVGTGGSQNQLVRASKATQFWRLKVVQ